MDPVPGNADDALDHVESGLGRREKHHDVTASDLTIGEKRAGPTRAWSELDPVNKNVISNEQRVLHRAGGDLKRLDDKRDDEQASHQHRCQRCQELNCCFARLFFLLRVLLGQSAAFPSAC